MTRHFYDHPLVKLHYYKYGNGKRNMLCFHGFGMHGKQFRVLEESLGSEYTFYGFDLFFHKETKLVDQSINVIKKGISKQQYADLIVDFCKHEQIDRFSVIGYSMGSHYATAITEQLSERIDAYIVAAPAALNPGKAVRFFSKNKLGNKILEGLVLNEKVLFSFLSLYRRFGFVDQAGYQVLLNEMSTDELRLNFYASLTYLRSFDTDEARLTKVLQQENIKSIFIFGDRDKMYPQSIGKKLVPKLNRAEVLVLDVNHEMINKDFADKLSRLLI